MRARGGRRKKANERFQRNVLHLTERLLPSLHELWDGDPDDRATAAAELERLSRSAEAVGLDELAATARELVTWTGDGASAASMLTRTLRGKQELARFAPVHVVADGRMATLLRRQATWTAEPLFFSSDVEGLYRMAGSTIPSAVVLPHTVLDDVATAADLGGPVFVYGPENDWKLQGRAVHAGASGFLRANFDLGDLLRRSRRLFDVAERTTLHVFLLGDEGAPRAAYARALESMGMTVVSSNVPTAVVPALDQVVPHAIVLQTPVGGRHMLPVLGLARAHPRGGVPVVVVGARDGARWIAGGADDALPDSVTPDDVAANVFARCQLHAQRAATLDTVTSLPERDPTLAALDALVAHAHRRMEPLSVALIEICDLAAIERRWQRSGVVQVRSAVGETVAQTVRRTDLVGCVGQDAFMVALRGVYGDVARRRMGDVERRFARNARGQHLLRDVRLAFGVADTEATVERLAVRAQADLEANRGPVE